MGNEQTPQPPSAAAAPHRSAGHEASIVGTAHTWFLDRIGGLWALCTHRPISLYAASVLRIGYGLLYLIFLIREFPHRDEIWGPGSPWTPALAQELFDQTGWSSVLILSDSRPYFELCYLMAVLTSTLFMLGWRTRARHLDRGDAQLRHPCHHGTSLLPLRTQASRSDRATGHAHRHRSAPGTAPLLRRDDRRGRRVPSRPLLRLPSSPVATRSAAYGDVPPGARPNGRIRRPFAGGFSRQMELRQLRSFVTVAEELHFGRRRSQDLIVAVAVSFLVGRHGSEGPGSCR